MPAPYSIYVIIPALNEELSIGLVLEELPRDLIEEVIVVDNNSIDGTAAVAGSAGATVVSEREKGYGAACLAGMGYIRSKVADPERTVIVFLDGDYADHPGQIHRVVRPIVEHGSDMVIGSRRLGRAEKGSLTPQQVFGNWLAVLLIRQLHGFRYTDLGPFRAITWHALEKLGMADRNYGWTVEMQVKAIQTGLRVVEVPVDYRRRIGMSKVSGTIKGTILAGYKIITTIIRHSRRGGTTEN